MVPAVTLYLFSAFLSYLSSSTKPLFTSLRYGDINSIPKPPFPMTGKEYFIASIRRRVAYNKPESPSHWRLGVPAAILTLSATEPAIYPLHHTLRNPHCH